MKELKVYVVGGQYNHAEFLTQKFSLTKSMEEANIIIFTGGEDVSPGYYDEDKGKYTSCNANRDAEEAQEFQNAIDFGKLMIGICRGLI